MTTALAANIILGTCATLVGATGLGKWPRLFCWLGGMAFGMAALIALRI